MYDTILFPTDGSDTAMSVLDYVIDIADEHDATIHVLFIADTNRESITTIRGEVVDALEQAGQRTVETIAETVRERGVDTRRAVQQGDPLQKIVDYARKAAVDLVVMPTHGRRGVDRLLLGSVTERVLNTSPVPVVVVNPTTERPLRYPCRELLVATDGSPGADQALAEGIDIAAATGSRLHVLYVVETGQLGPDARSVLREHDLDASAQSVLDDARTTAMDRVDDVATSVVYGLPHREIRRYVEDEPIDLLVLGTQGRTEFSWYTLGGVASKLVRSAPVPLLMTRLARTDSETPVETDGV